MENRATIKIQKNSWHSFFQYMKYAWGARGRHGIHSPFVYAFIEDVIQDRGKKYTNLAIPDLLLPLGQKYGLLASRICAHFNYSISPAGPGNFDMLVLLHVEEGAWVTYLEQYSGRLKNDSCILIWGIHQSPSHSENWDIICRHRLVKMSLDLFGIGLLFFKQEFKERQHFVLKY